MRISEVLQAKPSQDVITISPDAGVRELIALLDDYNIGALIVSSDGSTLEGIVSERDVVRHLHRDGTVVNNTVSKIMTTTVETCDEDTHVDELMKTMTDHRVRHVPVVRGDVLIGIISIGDVVKHRIGQLEFERDQLDSYVHRT